MTTEEKARRYDKALERAKKLNENPEQVFYKFSPKEVDTICNYMFPELKEEDERIKNEIIAFVEQSIHRGGGTPIPQEQEDKWIAWLEKQGEQKPIDKIQLGKKYKCIASPRYSTFRRGNIYKPVDNFLCNLMNLCYECFEPIEDSEQKPTDEDMKEALRTEYEKGRADTIAEMQVAWSEEDEETLGWLCTFLNIYGHEFYEGNEENVIDWLKSFKSRIQLQQEWSEEDETTINNLVWAISNDCIRPQDREDYCDWLKSLKDRYSWKPSDKQREALEHFVRSIEESGYASPYDNNTKLLYSLLSDLKKLKGE